MLIRTLRGVVRNEAGAKKATKLFRTQPLAIGRGDHFTLRGDVIDEDEEPVSLAGSSLYWSVATWDALKVKVKISANIIDAALGKWEVPGVPGHTSPLSLGEYKHDLELVSSDNKSTKVIPASPFLLEQSPYNSDAPISVPLSVPPLAMQLPMYSNATRPAPAALVMIPIWNTDLETVQISTGSAWLTLAMEA